MIYVTYGLGNAGFSSGDMQYDVMISALYLELGSYSSLSPPLASCVTRSKWLL